MNIITKKEAYTAVKEKIQNGEIFNKFKDLLNADLNFINQIDLNEIIVPTQLFPENVVDKLISVE
jgi:hypothetical protein